MNTRRPFRLTLKTKSTDSESSAASPSKSKGKGGDGGKGSGGSAAAKVHPLAGQQDMLRMQYSQQAQPGPSQSNVEAKEALEEAAEEDGMGSMRSDVDVETMSAAERWFSSLSTDDESLRSSPSPSEVDLDTQDPLLASMQEVLLQQNQMLGDSGEQASRTTGSSNFSVIRVPNQPTLSSLTAEGKQAELVQLMAQESQTTTPAMREGGILRRLKRISKKEKGRAVEEEEEASRRMELEAPSEGEKEGTLPPAQHAVEANEAAAGDPATLTLRDAAKEKTPQLERRYADRIHSVEPSLVDNESLAGRDSRPYSPLEFDDDDLEQRLTMGRSEVDDIQSLHGHIGFIGDDEFGEEAEGEAEEKGEGEGEGEGEWQLGSVPGSFFANRSSVTTHSSGSASDSEYQDVSTPSIDVGYSASPPITDVEPGPVGEASLHEAGPSEYSQALSRQPSSAHERMPSLQAQQEEEEEATTPRATAEDDRSSYFGPTSRPATTSSGLSLASASTPTKLAPKLAKTYDWYEKADLTAQQRHSFLRHVVSRELAWESERLFMLSSSADLFQPSPSESLPRTDLGYFKSDAKGLHPSLPLLRFLFTHILSTCPLFGPAHPIEGAAAIRATMAGAKHFFDFALLPLLHFRQHAGLNHSVDLHGEWPQESFDSPTTTGVMYGSTFKLVTRLIMAVVVDKQSRAWDWSAVGAPLPPAYLSHRVKPSQLKQGGMEVNIVGARMGATSKECELLLSVRRYGFPLCFVVRTESDFYEYARGLAEELGRRSRIRAVPPPAGQEISPSTVQREEAGPAEATNAGPRKIASMRQIYTEQLNGSQSSLQSLPLPARPKAARTGSSESVARLKAQNRSSASIGSSNPSPRISNDQEQQRQPAGTAVASPKSTLTEKARFFYRGKTESTTEVDSQTSLATGSSTALSLPAPFTQDVEARRKQLRAWLRDALSVRGAGHTNETRAFLSNGNFPEKDIKAATKRDVTNRMEIDAQLIKEREKSSGNAADEIVELRREMGLIWQDCVQDDGLVRAYEAVKKGETFSSLPLPYQRVISWTNLQAAQFLHHVFLNSHEARRNFDRATELVQCIPWKALSLALREPTGLMIQKVKTSLTQEFILKKILALHLEDVPAKKVETEVAVLRKRLGSTIVRKLQGYVNCEEWQRRVIRKASKSNDIPLVCAIVRGSDKPLLAAEGLKRIVAATKVYQDFTKSQPTYEEHRAKAKANVDVRLICDMQRALRLLCLQRNGEKVRAALADKLKAPVQAFVEPLFSLLKRLHRTKLLNKTSSSGKDAVTELQQFVFKLFDVIAGLKMRIQDAWRSVNTLTLFLDDAVPSWYQFLHRFANVDGLLLDLTLWMKGIAQLFRPESAVPIDQIARLWQPPKGGLNKADLANVAELSTAAKRKRARQMEAACRWAAGDTDADHSIQVQGEAGKTRVTPYSLPHLPAVSSKTQVGFEIYLGGLRAALDSVM